MVDLTCASLCAAARVWLGLRPAGMLLAQHGYSRPALVALLRHRRLCSVDYLGESLSDSSLDLP